MALSHTWTHRTQTISKNWNLYPQQSQITLFTLPWDTLYNIVFLASNSKTLWLVQRAESNGKLFFFLVTSKAQASPLEKIPSLLPACCPKSLYISPVVSLLVQSTFGLVKSYDLNKIEYQRNKTIHLDTIFASFIHAVQMLPKIVKENIQYLWFLNCPWPKPAKLLVVFHKKSSTKDFIWRTLLPGCLSCHILSLLSCSNGDLLFKWWQFSKTFYAY